MKIAHLADIQIRAQSRHEEYKLSFSYLYDNLRSQQPDRIVIAGDLVHNKTNISPELVDIFSNFLRSLSSIAPTDIILGNHDLSMKNLSRLDAITPVVNALQLPAINFMRASGIYPIDDAHNYVVMSCIDSEEVWQQIRKMIDPNKINIGLWHGTVNGVLLDNEYKLESPHSLKLFDGLDYVMLGDIHKTQTLGNKKRIAYPGSYPKQSFGESIQGGYYLWDIQSKDNHSLNFMNLPTVCPFYTIVLDKKNELPREPNIQHNARIRLMGRDLNAADRKQLTDIVKQKFNPIELKIIDESNIQNTQVVIEHGTVSVEDLRNSSIQENMIATYLKDKSLTPSQLTQLYEINRKCNVHITEDVARNVKYKIKSIGFDNLFSYGENNKLDLSEHRGIVGVFGNNRTGKSSLVVDVPMYCLFNKISKDVSKNNEYVNDAKDYAACSMDIELGDSTYTIERETLVQALKKKNSSPQEKGVTSVNFSRSTKNATQDLNGLERSDTDKAIRHVFGTADDYMLTSVAPQFDLLGFVDYKGADRKKTIARYFDLEIFEEKHKIANEVFKSLKRQISQHVSKDFDASIEFLKKTIEAKQRDISSAEQQAHSDRRLYEFSVQQISNLIANNDNFTLSKETFKLKTTYKHHQREIESYKLELVELQSYSCITNTNCCMRERKLAVENRLQETVKDKSEIVSQMQNALSQLNSQEANKKNNLKITEQTKLRDMYGKSGQDHWKKTQQYSREISTAEAEIISLRKSQQEIKYLHEQYTLYDYFVKAMSKDGISYNIVSKNLSLINAEIQKIISSDTNFNVFLEDNDKEINVYFQEGTNDKRLIELCSGMEKTIAAIAIRAALISVTSLPVSNLFILDESFTSLDVEHLEAMGRILNGLKRIFDTVIIICHHDYVKDLCDSIITIDKDEYGYSRILQ